MVRVPTVTDRSLATRSYCGLLSQPDGVDHMHIVVGNIFKLFHMTALDSISIMSLKKIQSISLNVLYELKIILRTEIDAGNI